MVVDPSIKDIILPPITFEPPSEDIAVETVYGKLKANPEHLRSNDLNVLASEWISSFNSALEGVYTDSNEQSKKTLQAHFAPHGTWKDHLGFEFDLHTFSSDVKIIDKIVKFKDSSAIGSFAQDTWADGKHYPNGVKLSTLHPATEKAPPIEWLHVFITFKTKLGHGKGVLRLISVDDETAINGLKALSIYTTLEGLNDPTGEHVEKTFENRPKGVNHGQNIGRKSWLEKRKEALTVGEGNEPTVLIIGGGQGGLTCAARLQTFGIRSLIIEKNPKIGDNWRNRYKFLVLHDPIWYDHLPYIHFPATWPIFTPKDKLGDWFEAYAKSMELNVWNETTIKSTTYHPETKSWTVETVSVHDPTDIKVVHPSHVILATGQFSEANIPKFEGLENFKGKVHHSSQHTSGADWTGKKALVVGSCNSAHDICQDFHEQGANVTMVQRSSTCVISSTHGVANLWKGVYEEDGPPVETADIMYFGVPLVLTNAIGQQISRTIAAGDKPLLEGLKKVGFKLDFGYAGSGISGKAMRQGGGYYIDVGCSTLIIDGKVKVKNGAVDHFTETGVVF